MVHLNFSILNDKPSLFLPIFFVYRYILGLGIGFLPERFFLALAQQDVNCKVSPKFYVLEYYAEESHFGGLKKLRKVV